MEKTSVRFYIHYVCPICLTDIYKNERVSVITCTKCNKNWCTESFRVGSFANGVEENSKTVQELRCDKHDNKNCKECAKKELYSE